MSWAISRTRSYRTVMTARRQCVKRWRIVGTGTPKRVGNLRGRAQYDIAENAIYFGSWEAYVATLKEELL